MRIVQMSDIHTGTPLFRPDFLEAAVEEANSLAPDLVAVAGDLTTEGYRWEFEEAKRYLDRLECPNVVYIMGNHDAKNVGYRHFEDLFGARSHSFTLPVAEREPHVRDPIVENIRRKGAGLGERHEKERQEKREEEREGEGGEFDGCVPGLSRLAGGEDHAGGD